MVRKPSTAPSLRASSPASTSIRPSAWQWRMSASYRVGTCALGIIRKCTGARGCRSWKASTYSSSCTFFAGISPRTILQKMQLGSLTGSLFMLSRRLFVEPRDALAPVQLGEHVARPEALAREQDHAVEPEIGDLAHEVQPLAPLRRAHRFGRFLADFLQHGVLVPRQAARHVRLGWIGASALLDDRSDALQGLGQSGLHFL